MGLVTDVGTYLADEVAELVLGENLFLGQWGDVDTATVLFQRPGTDPDFSLGATEGEVHLPNFENLRLQVLVRRANTNRAYPEGEELIYRIWRKLMITGKTLNGTRYVTIEPKGSPSLMEEDKKGRLVFVANFWAQPEVSA